MRLSENEFFRSPGPLGFGITPDSFIDLLMGLFRGAVCHHGGVPQNCPLVLMGRFPSLMGRFPTLMGRLHECFNGPFSSWKSHERQPIKKRGLKSLLILYHQFNLHAVALL